MNKVMKMYVSSARNNECLELLYQNPVDQFDEEELDKYADMVKTMFGEEASCDWRDEQTLWIWIHGYPFYETGE